MALIALNSPCKRTDGEDSATRSSSRSDSRNRHDSDRFSKSVENPHYAALLAFLGMRNIIQQGRHVSPPEAVLEDRASERRARRERGS
jgi:hypothetical protein